MSDARMAQPSQAVGMGHRRKLILGAIFLVGVAALVIARDFKDR